MCYVFVVCGLDEVLVEVLWEVYFSVCNWVEFYLDSLLVLCCIVVCWLVVSFINGNVDLECVGIVVYFCYYVSVCEVGVFKL